MAMLAAAAPFIALAGTAVSAVGTIAAGQQAAKIGAMEQQRLVAEGKAAKQAAEYQAAQFDVQAKNERAMGQREAEQYRRQKKLALSKLTAGAAASGFSATDATALALSDEIEEYGTLQEQMAAYGGEARATGSRAQAEATRFSGANAYRAGVSGGNVAYMAGQMKRNASYYSAAGTIMGGISSFATSPQYLPRTAVPVSRYGSEAASSVPVLRRGINGQPDQWVYG